MPEYAPIINPDNTRPILPNQSPLSDNISKEPVIGNSKELDAQYRKQQFNNIFSAPYKDKDAMKTYYTPEPETRKYPLFNPLVDNEEIYAQQQSPLTQTFHGITKGVADAGISFAQTLLFQPNAQWAEDAKSRLENFLPNYYSHWQQQHPVQAAIPFFGSGANFWFDKVFKGTADMLGMIGANYIQSALIGLATGGIGEIGTLSEGVGNIYLKASKFLSGVDKTAEFLKDMNLEGRELEAIQGFEKTYTQNVGREFLQNTGHVATNTIFSHMMASQGAKETYDTIHKDLHNQFVQENGYEPTGEDLTNIEKTATSASNVKYGTDFALFMVQALAMPHLLNSFKSAINPSFKGVEELTSKMSGKVSLEEGAKTLTDADKLKYESTKGNPFVNNYIKPFTKNMITLGGITVGTETSKEAVKKYFEDKYNKKIVGNLNDIIKSTVSGLENTFGSNEGLEGILSSMMTGGILGIVEHALEARNARKSGQMTPEERGNYAYNQMNNWSASGIFENNYAEAAATMKSVDDMNQAIKDNDPLAFKAAKDDHFFNFITSGIKNNLFDVRIAQLEAMKEIPLEELNKSLGLPKDTDSHKYIDSLIDKAHELKRAHDAMNKTLGNPFVYKNNPKTEEELKQNELYQTFEDYKSSLVKLSYNKREIDKDVKNIEQEAKKVDPRIDKDLLSKLTDPNKLRDLKEEYKDNIRDLEEQLRAKLFSGKDLINKKEQLKHLNTLVSKIEKTLDSKTFNGVEYHPLFNDLLNYEVNGRNLENQVPIDKVHIADLYDKGYDLNKLTKQVKIADFAYDFQFSKDGYDDFIARTDEARKALDIFRSEAEMKAYSPIKDADEIKDNKAKPEENRQWNLNKEHNPYTVSQDGDKWNVKNPFGEPIQSFDTKAEAEENRDYENKNLSDLKSITPTGKKADDGRIEVVDSKGNVQWLDPRMLENYQPTKTEAEIVAARKEFNKNLQVSVKKQTDKNKPTVLPENDDFAEQIVKDNEARPEAKKPSLSTLFLRGTYNEKDGSPIHKRREAFAAKIDNLPNHNNLRLILITPNTEEAFGLKGLSDAFLDNLGEVINKNDPEQGLVMRAMVEQDADGSLYYVNNKGERIGKAGEEIPNILEKGIFDTMPTTDLSWRSKPDEKRFHYQQGQTEEDALAYQKAWKAKRKQIFKWKGDKENLLGNTEVYEFLTSRGIAQLNDLTPTGKVDENGKEINKRARNAVGGTLIDESKIGNEGLIEISTTGKISHNGEDISVSKGVPLFHNGSTLEYLSNRKLIDKEISNIYNILKYSAKEGKFNQDVIDYLQGVINFTTTETGKSISRNQVYLKDGFLYFGNNENGVPFTEKGIKQNSKLIEEYLGKMYNGVNNRYLKENRPFTEISINDKGELESFTWKSYQHYLLSDKYISDDAEHNLHNKSRGGVDSIPLTTPIRKVVEDVPNDSNFIYKSFIIQNQQEGAEFLKIEKKKEQPEPIKETKPKDTKETPIKFDTTTKYKFKSSTGEDIAYTAGIDENGKAQINWVEEDQLGLRRAVAKILTNKGKDLNDPESQYEAVNQLEKEVTDYLNERLDKKRATTVKDEKKIDEKAKEIKKEKKPNSKKKPNPGFGEEQYRIVDNFDYVKADLNKEEKWMKENLSTVPFNRLENIIRTTNGGTAFGVFKDAAIHIWENAEVGTTYHEAFHSVWDMFTTLPERETLLKEFNSREGSFIDRETGETVDYKNADEHQILEKMAEEFRNHVITNNKPQGNALTRFFRDLVNMIKKLISPESKTIDQLFKRINSGYYNTGTSVSETFDRADSKYRVPGISASKSYHLVKDITSRIISRLFATDEGLNTLVNFENPKDTPSKVFEDIYNERATYYTDNDTEGTIPDQFENGLINEDQFKSYQNFWANVDKGWDTVKADIVDYLKTLGIDTKFSGEYVSLANEESYIENNSENADSADYDKSDRQEQYLKDEFKLDAKRSAGVPIKLLLSTLFEASFQKEAQPINGLMPVSDVIDPNTGLRKMLPYAKTFNTLMSTLYNLNTPSEKQEKLKELAQKDPNYVRLYNRLGFNKPADQINAAELKLQTIFFSVFSKQRPETMTTIKTENGKETSTFSSNTVANTGRLLESWMTNLVEEGLKSGLVEEREGVPTFKASKLRDASLKTNADKSKFLSSFGIQFDPSLMEKLSAKDQKDLSKAINGLKEGIIKNPIIVDVNKKTLGEQSNLERIAEILTRASGEGEESTIFGLKSEQRQTYLNNNTVSNWSNDLNNVKTKEELFNKLPFLENDPYRQDSWYLSNLFNEDGTRKAIKLETKYTQGINDQSDNRNPRKPIGVLPYAERVVHQINQELNKNYYILTPGDSKTEWMLSMEHIIPYSNFKGALVNDKVYNLFNKYYKTEKEIATEADGKINESYKSLTYPINGDYNTEELGKEKLTKFVTDRVEATKKTLMDFGFIQDTGKGFKLKGFDKNFMKANDLNKNLSAQEVHDFIKFREINYMLNNVEQTKLLFGDIVSKAKDWEKRVKSFLSPRQSSYYGNDAYNNILNDEYNKVGDTPLKQGDPGYWNHKDNMKTATIKDVYSTEDREYNGNRKSIVNDASLPKEIREAYEKNNVADAGAWVNATAYREILTKSQQTFTKEQEQQYQYELAKDRMLIDKDSKAGILPKSLSWQYSSEELRKADEELLSKGDPKSGKFAILKTVGTGVDAEGNTFLHKKSIAPQFYSMFRKEENGKVSIGNGALAYLKDLRQGVSYHIAESGVKIGAKEKVDFYNKEGQPNIEQFNLNQISSIPFRYYGIQVETQGSKEKQTLGSQVSKLVKMNFFNGGLPIDIQDKYNLDTWNGLSEKEKLDNSPVYKAIKRYSDVYSAMHDHGYNIFLNKLGIEDLGDRFAIPDKSKVLALLQNELLRREAPENIKDAIKLNDQGEFVTAFEALPNYKQIKDIFSSQIEKNIAKPKMNGGPKIMLSNLGFEVGDRKITQKMVKGNPVYVSSGLEFYTAEYDNAGKRTKVNHMEIMLPMWFKNKLKGSKKWKNSSNEEILNHLNNTEEGKNILKGIGFRIPTQETNSSEAFIVKDFLPDMLGDTIVVPEALTTKAGIDFDVDKMNTYLKNVYVDSNDNIKEVPFFGIGHDALNKVKDFILGNIFEKKVTERLDAIDNLSDEDLESDGLYSESDRIYKESLENEYFNSMNNLILHPDNYERLIVPNSADKFKKIASNLTELAPEEFGDKGVKSPLDSSYMANGRHGALVVAQGGVGIAAVGQTNNAYNQLQPIYLDPAKLANVPKKQRDWLGTLDIKLPHNTININGIDLPSFSSKEDTKGNLISNNISQVIDGTVDYVKDPWLSKLVYSKSLLSPALTIMKLGTDPETTFMFLNQPVIREYLKFMDKNGETFLNNDKLVKSFYKVQEFNSGKAKSTEINTKDLKNNISKYYKDKGKFTEAENAEQKLILQEFLKYNTISSNLFDVSRVSDNDTNPIVTDADIIKENLNREKALNNNVISGINNLLNNTGQDNLFKKQVDAVNAVSESLSNLDYVKDIRNSVIGDIANISRLNKEDYNKAARDIDSSLITYMVQTESGLSDRIKEMMIDRETSVANKLLNLKKSIPKNSSLTSNSFLNKLFANIKGDTKNIGLLTKVNDILTSDTYTNDLRELRDNASTNELYKDLVNLSFLQSGVSKNALSYSEYLPHEDYSEMIQPLIENISHYDLTAFKENGAYFRNAWSNTRVVPETHESRFEPTFYNPEGGVKVGRMEYEPWHKSLREKYNIKEFWNRPYKVGTGYGVADASYITMNLIEKDNFGEDANFGKVLLKRLEDSQGNPIIEGSNFTNYVYIPINAWGNGVKAQEYYSEPKQSEFKNGYRKVTEIPAEELLNSYNKTEELLENPKINRTFDKPEEKSLSKDNEPEVPWDECTKPAFTPKKPNKK